MASKLKNLSVEKIALVPEGDNKGAEALIYKSREQQPQTGTGGEPQSTADTNGGLVDMKIDKSKLTQEEQAQLDAIIKKAEVSDDPAPQTEQPDTGVNKTAPSAQETPAPSVAAAIESIEHQAYAAAVSAPPPEAQVTNDDIYKGLHPAVAAELRDLRKRADEAENRELLGVAKKYEIIGKKPEELAPILKNLKAAGGNAYEEMIAILDASVQAVEKAGVFNEIGKSGRSATSGADDAWAQIEKHAEAIQKAAPNMPWYEAVDKACEQHPDLVHEYERSR